MAQSEESIVDLDSGKWTLTKEPYVEDYFATIAPISLDNGVWLYKLVDGRIVSRTDTEIQEDIDAIPLPEPTLEERLRADVDYLLMLVEA